MLNRLNTHGVGLAGLAIGGGSIVASVAAFFKLLSDPTYLDALFVAVMHARKHALEPADIQTYAQLAAVLIAIVGALVVALLLSFLGRPMTVPSDGSGAPQAPSPPGKES